MQPFILILYFSRTGGTANLAQYIARGVRSHGHFEARLRTVAPVSAETDQTLPAVPQEGAIYCQKADLAQCGGLALGSPTRFGNMAAPLKYFIDSTSDLWLQHKLIGKPAAVFCSSASQHGGQESTLLSMALPLLHHGMLLVGVPYTEPALVSTNTGGTPYGASHLAREQQDTQPSKEEAEIAQTLGARVANLASRLKATEQN